MNNKNLAVFIIIGFVVTIVIWGFVGGCGSMQKPLSQTQADDRSVPGKQSVKESFRIEKGTIYVVAKGDSLWQISQRFGVAVDKIKTANNLTDDKIEIGQHLLIPGTLTAPEKKESQKITETSQKPVVPGAKPTSDLVVYKVRKGDSLWRIAQMHGVTVDRIAELNGIPRNARLSPGVELLVPKDK